MFLTELHSLPEELVSHLDPSRVHQYVRASGWVERPELRDRTAVYQRPESDLEQIQVPLARTLRDFTPRMAEAVAYIAQWEKRPAIDLLYELLLPPADRLSFRESGPAVGSIDLPLDHGLELLTGARKLVLAAACSVLRPEPLHSRNDLAEAEQFVRSCRLAYPTGVGFAIMVACPLELEPGVENLADLPPLARRVTTLLMRSLQRLQRALAVGDASLALAKVDGEPPLSINLCQALLDMTPLDEGAALTVTAALARTVPLAGVELPSSVRLQHEDFRRLASLVSPAGRPRKRTGGGTRC